MIAQKQTYIPTVNSIPVTNFPQETDFTTDFIEFKDSHKDWSIDITMDGTTTGALITVLVSNTQDGTYVPYKTLSTDVDLSVEANRIIFDDIMPFRYMKLFYKYGSSVNTISIKMSI